MQTKITNYNAEELGQGVIGISVVEIIYIIIIQSSIASAPAKLYWILNLIACVPLVYVIWFAYTMM